MSFSWLRSSGTRIALIFSATTIVLLLVVNVVISQRGSQIFWSSVPPSGTHTQQDIQYNQKPAQMPPPAQIIGEGLVQKFQGALIWITAAAILFALLLGIGLGYIFITRPLRQLQQAVTRLKQHDFQLVRPTGLPEFDQVVADFNNLASELQRAENLRRNLISDTSHELKTPIQSLLWQIQGMRDGLIPFAPAELDRLLVQVDQLDSVSEQLQDYARLRSQLVRVNPVRLALLPFMTTIVQNHAVDCARAKVKIRLNIPTESTLYADPVLLERLLSNLIRNTLTHAKAHVITIAAGRRSLRFADDGIGVDSKHLSHLFERFYRAHPHNKSGLGLGLGIVSDIVEAHGWTAKATSPSGKGLCITMFYPESQARSD